MSKIKILEKDVVNKIAAGEVIERPASVVKELVENSLDAKSSSIKIEIEKSGLKKIEVSDDGVGMSKEDLKKCFYPHATSKISKIEDLEDVKTLGFRGEALASISAVSGLTVRSREDNDLVGNELRVDEEEIVSRGMAKGTCVVVENLFSKVPARKKFLKTPATELRQILLVATKLALAFPEVGFSLIHNGKSIFDLPKEQSLEDRVYLILGKDIYQSLIPFNFESPYLKGRGFMGKPQIAIASKRKQYIFVNNRPVKSLDLSLAIKKAYGSLLDSKSQPIFILFLDFLSSNIDVNIHPKKEEVKFLNSSQVSQVVSQAVKKELEKRNLVYTIGDRDHLKTMDGGSAKVLKDKVDLWQVRERGGEEIIQIDNTYLITENKGGILIIDQHAAHERILYEQLLKTFKQVKEEREVIKKEEIFELPLNESVFLKDNLEMFSDLGFEIEFLKENSFKVSLVPVIFQKRNISELISQIIEDFLEDNLDEVDDIAEKTISYLACKGAIKSGDYLDLNERKRLIEKLENTETKYTCPHGRPVKIEISISELEKMFKRR